MIENGHVGIHVVQVVRIRWILCTRPVLWQWRILVKYHVFRLRLIVDGIKPSYLNKQISGFTVNWQQWNNNYSEMITTMPTQYHTEVALYGSWDNKTLHLNILMPTADISV